MVSTAIGHISQRWTLAGEQVPSQWEGMLAFLSLEHSPLKGGLVWLMTSEGSVSSLLGPRWGIVVEGHGETKLPGNGEAEQGDSSRAEGSRNQIPRSYPEGQ